jgi:hypothetical protein
MSAAYKHTSPEAIDAFASSRRMFDSMLQSAASARTIASGHADVEAAILAQGQGLLKQLYQDHLDLRHAQERRVDVVDETGAWRTERRVATRTLRSRLGDVTVTRFLYQAAGHEGRAPADAALRLCEDGFSMGVRKEVARLCASDAFAPAVETLERLTGVHVAHRQAEELARRAANDVCRFYSELPPEPEADEGLLVLSFDAAGIVMRRESLRAATRKKAENEPTEAKFPPKLKSGKKPNRKRMAQVGAVYTVAPFVRTADDIVGELESLTPSPDDRTRPLRPRPLNKRLYASIARSPADVIADGFRDALARDPERQRRWVVLLDGNADQLQAVSREARRIGVEITIVADLIHLIEYLWPAAYCFHAAGSDEARDWVVARVRALLEGADPVQVAAGMRRSATRRDVFPRSAVDRCAEYMHTLAPYMRYGEALRDGLPIATGVIEGACRHLVRRRLDIGGARWTTEGAEAILLLRAVVLSGEFDDYWAFHEAQVFHRTHAVKYRGAVPNPLTRRPALRRVK